MIHALMSDQTLVLILVLLLIAAAADFVTGAVAALLTKGDGFLGTALQLAYLPEFATSHLLRKVFPLAGAAILASVLRYFLDRFPEADQTVAAGLNVAIATAWGLAIAGTVAYVAASLSSIAGNVQAAGARDKGAPEP